MTQQINLLRRDASPWGTGAVAGLCLVVLLAGLFVYRQSFVTETDQLRQVADAGGQRLALLKSAITASQKGMAPETEAKAIASELATLKPKVEMMSQLTKELGSGALGSPQGYARHLGVLSAVAQEGVWLTSISVAKGGTALQVDGRALRNEDVMQYAKRLNDSFLPLGVRFNSLELTPDASGAPRPITAPAQAAPVQAPSSVAFKLS